MIGGDMMIEETQRASEAVPAGSAILRAVRILEAIAGQDAPPPLSEPAMVNTRA